VLEEPAELNRLAVTLCTANAWVRGVVHLGRLRRLSEVLNHPALDYVPVHDGEFMPFGARDWPRPHRTLYVNKADILFAHPTPPSDGPRPVAGLAVQKIPAPVRLYVGDFQVQGTVYLADRVPWEQFLTVLRDRFLALTGATITRAVSGEPVATVDFVAVNRAHLSVLVPEE
jgi:hypothetical protein